MSSKEAIPDVVGEGTYGCVHRPSLHCDKKKMDYTNKLSKIGTKKNINEELAEYKTIQRVDKKHDFFTGSPNSCLPSIDSVTLDAVDKCKDFEAEKIKQYKLLIMKDGGQNLEDFSKAIKKDLIEHRITMEDATRQMEKFWIEAHRMFLGVSKLLASGVVHHDLKHKNIVYNKELNRINFIDFGLMTTSEKIKDESEKSKYGFSIRHWSFPPEMRFLNKNKYEKLTDTEIKASTKKSAKKTEEKSKREKDFDHFLNELKDPNSHINTFFLYTDFYFPAKKQDSFMVQERTNEYYRMVMNSLKKDDYETFLDKSISTIDSYGLAISLIYVLNNTRDLIDDKLADDLQFLFLNMLNFNVMERISIQEAMSRYEDILENNHLLKKFNVHFENHQLKINTETVKKIKQKLIKIKIPNINKKISEKRLESDPITDCPDNMKYDKKRKKCIEKSNSSRKKKPSASNSRTSRRKL
jgi:serine/threonine protein kinase